MRYALKAVDAARNIVAVELEASDETAARALARDRGLSILSLARAHPLALALPVARRRFPVQLFSIELLSLLDAGLNVVEALQALLEREPRGASRQVIEELLSALRQGASFSQGLARAPEAFPPLFAATVRASERTGDLAEALRRYVAYQEEIDRVRRKVVSALLYPAVLATTGGLVLAFLLFYVVPRFARVYEDVSASLPFFSGLLLAFARSVESHGGWIALAVLALAATVAHRLSSDQGRAAIAARVWRLPGLGERLRIYQLARLYRTAGMLMQAGIPAIRALDMAGGLLSAALRPRLASAIAALAEGRRLSQALSQAGLATPVARRMMAVGEKGGRLGELMERVARFHDEETARHVDTFLRLFEPLLMAALGLAVGLVVVLMYMPVFELAGSLR